eukprot:1591839-Rhodomonas_salina.1
MEGLCLVVLPGPLLVSLPSGSIARVCSTLAGRDCACELLLKNDTARVYKRRYRQRSLDQSVYCYRICRATL